MTSLVKVLWRNITSINILHIHTHAQVYDGDLFEDLVYIIMETGKPNFFCSRSIGWRPREETEKKSIQFLSRILSSLGKGFPRPSTV